MYSLHDALVFDPTDLGAEVTPGEMHPEPEAVPQFLSTFPFW